MESTQNRSAEYGLEPENFRIDSTGWEEKTLDDGTRVKTNPEGDVTELLDGEFAGEQHFSQNAALRETAKAGKRMPTIGEWSEMIRSRYPDVDPEGGLQDAPGIAEAFGLPLAGYRLYSSAAYNNQSTFGYYWSASPNGTYGYLVYLSASQVVPASNFNRTNGFSVRCIKN